MGDIFGYVFLVIALTAMIYFIAWLLGYTLNLIWVLIVSCLLAKLMELPIQLN